MNGSSSNVNTFSTRQAKRMMESIDEIVSSAVASLEEETNNFFTRVNKSWADKKAVELASSIAKEMRGSINDLGRSSNELKQRIADIHNDYANVAGKQQISAIIKSFMPAIDNKTVKDVFDDGEHGIRNDKALGLLCVDYANYINRCSAIGDKLRERISSINAFGNEEVKRCINDSAFNLCWDIKDRLDVMMKNSKSYVEQIVRKYANVSSKVGSIGAALTGFTERLGFGMDNSQSIGSTALQTAFGVGAMGTGIAVLGNGDAIAGQFGGSNNVNDLHAGGSNSIRDFSNEQGYDDFMLNIMRKNQAGGASGNDREGQVRKYFDDTAKYYSKGDDSLKYDTYFDDKGNISTEFNTNGQAFKYTSRKADQDNIYSNAIAYNLKYDENTGNKIVAGGNNAISANPVGSDLMQHNWGYNSSYDSPFEGKLSNIDTSKSYSVEGRTNDSETIGAMNRVIDAYSDGSAPTNIRQTYNDETRSYVTSFDINDNNFVRVDSVDGNNNVINSYLNVYKKDENGDSKFVL